jgi:hypothetical protein
MKSQRTGKSSKQTCYHNNLLAAIRKFLPKRGLPLQVSDNRVRWAPRLLAVTAILMAWSAAPTLQEAFATVCRCVAGMYVSRKRSGKTYEGFMAALRRRSASLLATIVAELRRRTISVGGRHWFVDGWVPMVADGSRFECPRTEANEEAFGCAAKAKTTPQLFITTLYHAVLGVPWAWRHGGKKSSERGHLRELIGSLPEWTLLLADAGFTGYELLKSLTTSGAGFIIRVGANVRLLKKLGYAYREHDGIVYLWPQDKRDQAPMVLRLVCFQNSKSRVCLLSNVLDESQLSDRQIGKMYRLRWGVEVMYRTLKQTMERRKLRSVSPANATVELDWQMVGLWMLGLMTCDARRGSARTLSDWSPAQALRAVRMAMQRPNAPSSRWALRNRLRKAVKDRYQRRGPKGARNWPHKKTEGPPGQPQTRMATKSEKLQAQRQKQCKPTN